MGVHRTRVKFAAVSRGTGCLRVAAEISKIFVLNNTDTQSCETRLKKEKW
jgi:hypothetical protein